METVQTNIVALNVYIVNAEGKLCRIINAETNLIYDGVHIPVIHLTDNMIKKMLGRESLPFYEPRTGRINFYSDSMTTICNLDKVVGFNISIELLEVGDTYVLLSPGLWVTTSEKGNRRRLCDDSSLYDIISMLSAEALLGKDFMYELRSVIDRLSGRNQPVTEAAETITDKVDDGSEESVSNE